MKIYIVKAPQGEYEKKIADLEAKLAESEKLTERLQQIVDKLRDKEFAGKTLVNAVNSVYEPLYQGKCNEVEELKQQLHDLPKKIVKDIEKNFTEYLPLKYKTGAGFYARLNTILKKYGGEDE